MLYIKCYLHPKNAYKKDEITDISVHVVHVHNKKEVTLVQNKEEGEELWGKKYLEQLSKENSGLQTLLSHAKYFHTVIILKWEWKGAQKVRNPLISPISTRANLKVMNSS